MEKDLGSALEALFGKSRKIKEQETKSEETAGKSFEELIEQADDYYNLVLDSMTNQDWVGIGSNLDKLGNVLNVLSED